MAIHLQANALYPPTHRGMLSPGWDGYGPAAPDSYNVPSFYHLPQQGEYWPRAVYFPFVNSEMRVPLEIVPGAAFAPSSGSYGTRYGTSQVTATQTPEGRPVLSPRDLTPTSSEASSLSDDEEPIRHQEELGWRRRLAPTTSRFPQAATNPVDQPLRGLTFSPSTSRSDPNVPLNAVAPPLPQSLVPLRPSNLSVKPWNHLANCFQQPGPSASHAERRPGKPGKRSGPLSTEKREKANKLRKTGVCFRCWAYRESCDSGSPCERCKSPSRTWRFGCIRIPFKELWTWVQPDQICAHLTAEKFTGFIQQNVRQLDYSTCAAFTLRVGWKIGSQLELPVKEVEPLGHRLLEHDGYRIWPETEDHAVVERISLASPPLLPDFRSPNEDFVNLQNQLKRWVNEMLADKAGYIVWHCFWDDHQVYQREMMLKIWTYYHEVRSESVVLRNALRLLALNYCMTQALLIPDEDVEAVKARLKKKDYLNGSSSSFSSPKAIEMAVRMCIYPLVRRLAEITTKHFIDGCSRKSETCVEKDLTFCLAFILTIVLGRNQEAALGSAASNELRQADGMGVVEAKELIQSMETEFADNVLRMCQYRFAPSQKKGQRTLTRKPDPAEPAALQFGLREKLEELTAGYSDRLREPREIRKIDDSTFGGMNTASLLAKFVRELFPEWLDGI